MKIAVGIRVGREAGHLVETNVKPLTTLAQLEKWFENSDNPSASSRIAELMRELLEKNPNLSFEQLHQPARTGDVESCSQI